VVQCRPLGAVCLIDEGQADWKILAVNTEQPGPLAQARSVDDVERIAPGRIAECLKWIDDFKQSSGKGEAKLHFEVHDVQRAIGLIEQDHVSWRGLIAEVGSEGMARGHWVRSPEQAPAMPEVLKISWAPSCAVPGQVLRAPSVLVGARRPATLAPTLAARRTSGAGAAKGAVAAPLRNAGCVLRLTAKDKPVTATRAQPEAVLPKGVPQYAAPAPTGVSLWHDVELHVKTWLDEDTGLFRYVNEMPQGSLQKFEVQPHVPENAISEDPKGSTRLAAFGRPVPFNYGCLPQTYRDPEKVDELYNAPGDDDPLDILDLGSQTVGVGEVVQCRPLGAVCLIDEGQADWKILAVNTEQPGPLAQARSVDDVERIAPGRIAECLKWIDDFKQSSGKGEAKLHFEVHDAQRAIGLIEQDHVSWRGLIAEVGSEGMARGHWVRSPEQAPAMPEVLKISWAPSCAVPGQMCRSPSIFVGAQSSSTLVHATPPSRALALKHYP